jgi:hypothetical protein
MLGIIHSRGLRSNRTPTSCQSHVAGFVTITTCSRKTYMRTFLFDLICGTHIENPYSGNNFCKNTRAWKCIILSYFIRVKTPVSCSYTANISVSSDQHQTMRHTHSFVGQVKRSGSATEQYLHGAKNLLQSPASRTRSARCPGSHNYDRIHV